MDATLTGVLRGSVERNARRKRWLSMIHKLPREEGLNHVEEYSLGLQKSARFITFVRAHGIHDVDEQEDLAEGLGDVLPIDMHRKMFIPALYLSMTPEQLQTWLPLALSYRILGAYAQTELGHGSNVQGIETTATYDASSHTFVLHSPTLTSRKWWPGGMGKTANFAVVYARLLSKAVDFGVHAFLVQLRDLATHQSLPGISLGDIGPKVAFNMVDNGYCVFDHVHVPASQLCLATARVRWQRRVDGRFDLIPFLGTPSDTKWTYMPMVKTRVFLVAKCARFLGRAIAFSSENPTASLLPHAGLAFAAAFAGHQLLQSYQVVMAKRAQRSAHQTCSDQEELSALAAQLHATSSGLKAFVASDVVDGIECCMQNVPSSFLTRLRCDIVGASTYEGTFDVLVQQHAAFLVKTRKGEQREHLDLPRSKDWKSLDTLVRSFHIRAQEMLQAYGATSRLSMARATRLSVVHSEAALLQAMHDLIMRVQSPEAAASLTRLGRAMAYRWMAKGLHEFRWNGWLSSSDGHDIIHHLIDPTPRECREWLAVMASWDFTQDEVPVTGLLEGKL
ncbi:hypothetical protein H310_05539 [Aphanomyces invadans]|uniref:Acyl-coenzyme A oxidase n=1 Tax=Aphanomyces invadans TaxID=157072 RepID=A0A024UA72_9STRA|nr:hypothetical protein H310_05539 [Aphanomyces invadans]ETW03115.1 hypothetical protein H310_05539 [Aphanomyces invadans]|eukprot:XP_008868499.1 hypothetical protein H310_05539 [Aphanomyces invadans]